MPCLRSVASTVVTCRIPSRSLSPVFFCSAPAVVPVLRINLTSAHTIKGLLRESIDKSDAFKCADSCLLSGSDHVWEFVDHSDSITRRCYLGAPPPVGNIAGGLYVYGHSDCNVPCVDANETNRPTGRFFMSA